LNICDTRENVYIEIMESETNTNSNININGNQNRKRMRNMEIKGCIYFVYSILFFIIILVILRGIY